MEVVIKYYFRNFLFGIDGSGDCHNINSFANIIIFAPPHQILGKFTQMYCLINR